MEIFPVFFTHLCSYLLTLTDMVWPGFIIYFMGGLCFSQRGGGQKPKYGQIPIKVWDSL